MSSAHPQKGPCLLGLSLSLPNDLTEAVHAAREDWDSSNATERLWQRDPSLWTNTDEGNWLGWLTIIDEQRAYPSRFKALAAEIVEDGFAHIVLLGMGSASLVTTVFAQAFGKQANALQLLAIDSVDPEQIRRLRAKIDPARTLFCVASKSGETLEPNLQLRYFYSEVQAGSGDRAGQHFIAITDAGSKLEELAQSLGFRRVYHGAESLAGRFATFSDFGLIPHAAAGLDTEKLLKRASLMVEACKNRESFANPGVLLGLILGTAARTFGRDKVTIRCSPLLEGFGVWIEQMLAESTGKNGAGLIPLSGEPFAGLEQYGSDRLFIDCRMAADGDSKDSAIRAIEAAGQPVLRIVLNDLYDVGQMFFLWQTATAVASSRLGVHPFNQPEVEASKRRAQELSSGAEEKPKPLLEQNGLGLYANKANCAALWGSGSATIGGLIRKHIDRLQSGDYFAILAYLPAFPEFEAALEEIRGKILEAKQVATVVTFAPRYLHGAGQAYKSGPNSGVFLQITYESGQDLAIPDHPATFGNVQAVQAQADFELMGERDRRLLRIHLGKDVKAGLARLRDLVCAAVAH